MPRCAILSDTFLSDAESISCLTTRYSFEIYRSIKQIPHKTIETLELSKHFLHSVSYWSVYEQSFSPIIEFRYIVLSDEHQPIGLAPFQLITFKGSDAIQNPTATNNLWHNLIKRIVTAIVRHVTLKLLVGGNVFVTGEFALLIKEDVSLSENIVTTYYQAIQQLLQEERNISGVLLKDFSPHSPSPWSVLRKKGFFRFSVYPDMQLKIRSHWNSMLDYERDLNSHYRVRYRKALQRGASLKVIDMDLALVNTYRSTLQELFVGVWKQAYFKLATPDLNYLQQMLISASHNFYIKGIFLQQRLIGFYSAYYDNIRLVACFVGMDKNYLKSHDLYLNILYRLIEDAIKRNIKTLHLGRTAMEIKSAVGAYPQPLELYAKHVCFIRNLLLRLAIHILLPIPQWNLRHPFKKKLTE